MKKANQRLKNILFFEGAIDFGGSVKSLLLLLQHLDKSKYYSVVVCPYEVPYLKKFTDLGVEVKILKWSTNLFFSRLNHIFQVMWLIKRLNISLVLLNNGIYYPALIAARFCRIPIICYFRSLPYNIFTKKPTIPFLTRLFGRLSNHNIAISEAVKNRYVELGFNKSTITVIPDGIEIDTIREKASMPGQPIYKTNGTFVIGCVCRLSEEKGLKYLMEAMQFILDETKNIKCVLVGDGPLLNQLKQQTSDLRITENVIFVGHQDNPYPILSQFDIFILPSLREGLSISIMEAMVLGIPIIASMVGGVGDLVCSMTNGILIPPGDSKKIADSVISLYKNSDLKNKLAYNAHIKANAEFLFQKTIDRVELKYAELLKDRE
ncbi:MAG: glycosyltransferase [Candidatus Omnitrophota bacterium]